MSGGHWIKLHRKIKDWEWWGDVNTAHLFIHCLLRANFEDARWQGKVIKRGTFVTSLKKLSAESGLSVKQIRRSLDNLETTGEIATIRTNKNTTITICNYNDYQTRNDMAGHAERHTDGQTNGTLEGTQRATSKKNKEIKKNKDIDYYNAHQNPFDLYMNNFGMISPFIAQEISEWIDKFGEDIVIESMKRSLMQNKKSWNYANGILKNWENMNVKTLQDIQGLDAERGDRGARNTGNRKNDTGTDSRTDYLAEIDWERATRENLKRNPINPNDMPF